MPLSVARSGTFTGYFCYTIFVNQKILWKIEALWEKYYVSHCSEFIPEFSDTLSLWARAKQVAYRQGDFVTVIPTKVGIQEIKNLYINSISIYNPDFHMVQKFHFEKSEKPVHYDEYGEYFGLKYSQVLEKDGKLVYLFDNHNKIIQPFLEYVEITKVGSKASYHGFDVVHIDAHNDGAVFASQKPHHLELKNVQKYIQQTKISNFFDFLSGLSSQGVERKRNRACAELDSVKQSHSVIPAKAGIQKYGSVTPTKVGTQNQASAVIPAKAGIQGSSMYDIDSNFRGNDTENDELNENKDNACNDKFINNIHRYTKSTDFQEFKKPQNPYILSLDIDILGPEGDFTDLESKIKIIAQAWCYADVVCIATSPGFIDQDFAQKIIEIFTKREIDELLR